MIQPLIGVVTGMVFFSLGILYILIQVRMFDANFKALLKAGTEKLSSAPDHVKKAFNKVKEETQAVYRVRRKPRIMRALLGLILMALIFGLLANYVTHVFSQSPKGPSATLFLTLILVPTAAALYLRYFHDSDKCCVLKSSSASDPKIWLGVILPSVSKGGKLKIVQGSMNPYPFSEEWFFNILDWLCKKRKVNIEILSGEPDWNNMSENNRLEWKKYWNNIVKSNLHNKVRILPERPTLQFTLTNRLVRIEKEHLPWIERKKQENQRDALVSNHIHLFHFLLIWMFGVKFNGLWKNAKPVTELQSFQTALSGGDEQ